MRLEAIHIIDEYKALEEINNSHGSTH